MLKKHLLYLGIRPPVRDPNEWTITHYPMIKIHYRNPQTPNILQALSFFSRYTHFIFTSKTAIQGLIQIPGPHLSLMQKGHYHITVVGQASASFLRSHNIHPSLIPSNETAEGITSALDALTLDHAQIFWPHSALSRAVIPNYLKQRKIPLHEIILYDTVSQCLKPIPELDAFDEILFTSPSCVKSFLKHFQKLPNYEKVKTIGPITQNFFDLLYKNS